MIITTNSTSSGRRVRSLVQIVLVRGGGYDH